MHGVPRLTAVTARLFAGLLAMLLAVALNVSAAHAAALAIQAVRVGQNGQVTRLVLETNHPIKPQVFDLQHPDRLVLDMPTLTVKPDLNKVDLPPHSLLQGLRDGIFNEKTHRLVLDLAQGVKFNSFGIPGSGKEGYRFVLDMQPSGPKEPTVLARHETAKTPAIKPIPTRKTRDFVAVIDPGHGGIDPGAIGQHKTYEKDVVLAIARRVRDNLNSKPGFKVYLTRDSDTFVRLQDRVKKAQRHRADVFISIHADAHDDRRVRGGSVYVLSERASDKEAARLAMVANQGDTVAGMQLTDENRDVRDILIDLAQRETMNSSALLAKSLIQKLDKTTRMRSDDIKFAGFRVLKAPDIPSILIETAYISNPREERMLRSSAGQKELGNAIAEGIEAYVRKYRR